MRALGCVLTYQAATCRMRPHAPLVAFGVTGESYPSSSEDTNSLAAGRLISRGSKSLPR